MTKRPHCRARTASGRVCRIENNLRDGLCLWHDPQRAQQAKAARRKGGQGRVAQRNTDRKTVDVADALDAPETLDDIAQWASWCAHSVAVGLIDARTAREISYALTTLRGTLEKRDLAKELRELRDAVDALKERMSKEQSVSSIRRR